jgi:hypothetical protein
MFDILDSEMVSWGVIERAISGLLRLAHLRADRLGPFGLAGVDDGSLRSRRLSPWGAVGRGGQVRTMVRTRARVQPSMPSPPARVSLRLPGGRR